MTDPGKNEFEPKDLIDAKSNFDPGAIAPQQSVAGGPADRSGAPQPTPDEVAEETRREQAARPDGRPDRDDKLTHVGRGQQTHG